MAEYLFAPARSYSPAVKSDLQYTGRQQHQQEAHQCSGGRDGPDEKRGLKRW